MHIYTNINTYIIMYVIPFNENCICIVTYFDLASSMQLGELLRNEAAFVFKTC